MQQHTTAIARGIVMCSESGGFPLAYACPYVVFVRRGGDPTDTVISFFRRAQMQPTRRDTCLKNQWAVVCPSRATLLQDVDVFALFSAHAVVFKHETPFANYA